jgi:hypothetical protein
MKILLLSILLLSIPLFSRPPQQNTAKTDIPGRGPCTNFPIRYQRIEERLAWFYGCMHENPPKPPEIKAGIAALSPSAREKLKGFDDASQEAALGVGKGDLPKEVVPDSPTQQQNGQWVLQSYDSAKGYTFNKDGVSYQTKCFRIEGKVKKTDDPAGLRGLGYVLDGPNRFHMDIKEQSQCSELLEFIHKPISLTNGSIWGPDMLLVDRPEGATIYLQVTNAK